MFFLSRFLSRLRPTRDSPPRVRTPTLLQMEAVECGAVVLGIVLGYYGRIVPISELRRECGVSRNGSKASNIVKVARRYGMNAKGFKKSLEDVRQFYPPYIVFWNFNHFVVVEGFVGNKVYLNDPATGPRTVSLAEFDRAYTGIVLVMEPGSEFETGGEKPSVFAAIFSRLKSFRTVSIRCLAAGLLLSVPRLTIPTLTRVFIDEIMIENRQNWLIPALSIGAIAILLRAVLLRLRSRYLRRMQLQLSATLSGQFIWHTLRLPMEFYAQRFAGEIANRIRLNDRVSDILCNRLAPTVIDGVMTVIYLPILFSYDWLLSAIALSFALLNLIALHRLSRYWANANIHLSQENSKLSKVAIGGIQNIETVKASGLEDDLFSQFSGYHAKTLGIRQSIEIPTLFLTRLPPLLTALATVAVLAIGSWRVMGGYLTVGMLAAYQILMQEFLTPVNNFVNFGSTLQGLEADLNRLDDVLQNPTDPQLETRPNLTTESARLQGDLELQNISFGYSHSDPPLLHNFNLHLKSGWRVALVGGSGSGKSTVARLVAGLHTPWEGEILFDGKRRSDLPRFVLSDSLAMVDRDIFLFVGTVRDNLTLWDRTVPEADIIRACKDAMIHDFILTLPGGYGARLSEGGMNLSGGQRQRLEIARSLVRNPAILVLDEATGALDTETEAKIDRNLRRRGCSCLVVAHRLSTIRDCDEILVLSEGKVVERGTHDQLKQTGGRYAQLIGIRDSQP